MIVNPEGLSSNEGQADVTLGPPLVATKSRPQFSGITLIIANPSFIARIRLETYFSISYTHFQIYWP